MPTPCRGRSSSSRRISRSRVPWSRSADLVISTAYIDTRYRTSIGLDGTRARRVGLDRQKNVVLDSGDEQQLVFESAAAVRLRGIGATGGGDAVGAHLAIEVAALDAQDVGGAGDVALLQRQGAQDVVPLETLAGVVEGQGVAVDPEGIGLFDPR